MGQFRHPNIVRLHGVVTVGEPVSNGRGEGGGRTDGQMGGGGGGGGERGGGGGEEGGERGGDWRIRRGRQILLSMFPFIPLSTHTNHTHQHDCVILSPGDDCLRVDEEWRPQELPQVTTSRVSIHYSSFVVFL